MFGDDSNCPIRITTILGLDKEVVEKRANILCSGFQWQVYCSEQLIISTGDVVYSITLFNQQHN